MPAKVIPCALCQTEAAAVFCVNDDAHLCAGCDASVHAANPLLSRHERRPLSSLACQAECASAARGTPAASACTDSGCDAGVVPVLAAAPEQEQLAAPLELPAQAGPGPASKAAAAAAPMSAWAAEPAYEAGVPSEPLGLYEDAFLGRSLTASDLLDLDELELPGSSGSAGWASFDPLDDCVVPSWGEPAELHPAGGDRFAAASQQSSFLSQPYLPSYLRHPYAKPVQQQPAAAQPAALVPLGGAAYGAPAAAKPAAAALDPEAEAARVQRHRDRQRKKRAFGRTVRYQSRRAYAEIRPRIKGRFVTPEEYAAYQAQVAAAEQAAGGADDDGCGDAELPGGDAEAQPGMVVEVAERFEEDVHVVPGAAAPLVAAL